MNHSAFVSCVFYCEREERFITAIFVQSEFLFGHAMILIGM